MNFFTVQSWVRKCTIFTWAHDFTGIAVTTFTRIIRWYFSLIFVFSAIFVTFLWIFDWRKKIFYLRYVRNCWKTSPFLQGPCLATAILVLFKQFSTLSTQAVAYVFPLFPQTGLYSLVHLSLHLSMNNTKLNYFRFTLLGYWKSWKFHLFYNGLEKLCLRWHFFGNCPLLVDRL